MKSKILAIGLFLVLLCGTAFGQFRVGDAWQDIEYTSGMFYLGYGAGSWYYNQAPPVFRYKDIGDTIFVDIEMSTGGAQTQADALSLVVNLTNKVPPPTTTQVGIMTVNIGSPTQRVPAVYEFYTDGKLTIWPMSGYFPDNKWPKQDYPEKIGIFVQFSYKY